MIKKNKIFRLVAILMFMISVHPCEAQKHLQRIDSAAVFEKFSGLPLSSKYGEVRSVKVVYDIANSRLYFINSKFYKYHYQFCMSLPDYVIDLESFNRVNYSQTEDRDFLLGNINYYSSAGWYALEISPSDGMPIRQLTEFMRLIKQKVFFSDRLVLELNSQRLMDEKARIDSSIKTILPSDIYGQLNFQSISRNKVSGTIRIIRNFDDEIQQARPNDIIVINQTPVYIPPVAGVIVTEFQTPLSHLTLLGQNRKMPICACKDAFGSQTILSLENKNVVFEVTGDTFYLKEVEKIQNKERKNNPIHLSADLSKKELTDACDLYPNSKNYVGNKAANFGFLSRLSKKSLFKVPESAFAIPFYYYAEHVKKCGAQTKINELLASVPARNHPDSLKKRLDEIQDLILNYKADSLFIRMVENKIIAAGDYRRMRFRSSTNAEDASGFSGAGLYTSETGEAGNPRKSIEQAIRKVWASLWSLQAFSEREYFGIDHSRVYMGVLVHRSFPDEKVNGVAITKNLYRPDEYGFTVNAQYGDHSVVRPKGKAVCDQFICYPEEANELYIGKVVVDIISVSSFGSDSLCMSPSEIQLLADQLEIIKRHFKRISNTTKSFINFAVDVEFKLDGENRTLYIKQVRIFND